MYVSLYFEYFCCLLPNLFAMSLELVQLKPLAADSHVCRLHALGCFDSGTTTDLASVH